MITYVVGFAFNESKKQVVLIEKQHPSWQKGKLNGVGGKADQWVEETETTRGHIETPYQAMIREFEEETGLKLMNWELFATLKDTKKDITLHCYRIFNDTIHTCKTVTEEVIKICEPLSVITLGPPYTLSNIPMLLAMAMDRNVIGTKMFINLDHS